MLTAFQCDRVAYLTDGDIICRACVVDEYEDRRQARAEETDLGETWAEDDAAIEELLGYSALIRYTVEEEFPGGLWCGACGAELVEPAEDYCIEHEDWRMPSAEADGEDRCGYGERSSSSTWSSPCRFPDTFVCRRHGETACPEPECVNEEV